MRDLMNYFSNSDIKIHHDFASSLRLNSQVFSYCNASYNLPISSKQRLENYLSIGQPFLSPFGNISQADTLIAFSFGDSADVNIPIFMSSSNKKLRSIILDINKSALLKIRNIKPPRMLHKKR